MPSWKKVITSGSDASLNSLTVINGITGSLFGTASYTLQALSASYAETASYAPDYLPLTGGTISGTLHQSGTFYPDQIDWFSSSIGYNTGSYILTTTVNGLTTYAGYGDIANALAPYIPPISSSVSASYATTASYALTSSNVQGGTTNYIPIWNTDTSLSSSTIYQSNGNIGIRTTFPSASLHVFGSGSSTGSLSFLASNVLGTGSFRIYDNGNISNPGNNSNLYNEAFGINALESLNPIAPGGGATTALGPFALRRATQTRVNTAIGYAAMAYTTGSSVTGSVALGYFALAYQQSGSYNVAIGYQSMQGSSATPFTGSRNIGIGLSTLSKNTGGSNNVAVGSSAMVNNTTGNFGTALGQAALFSNTAGDHNTAIGDEALYSTTSGSYNVALGIESARGNTLGNYNVALGKQALLYNITGSYNVALGYSAGRATSASIFANNTENSIFIGTYTKPLGDNQTNQTVIGHEAIGIGSNTVTLGNDFVVTTALKGNVGIKTITPNAALDVNGSTIITGSLTIATGSSLLTVIDGVTVINTSTPALIISSSQSTALQVVGGNNQTNIALFKNLVLDSIVATIGTSGSIFSSGSITATQGFTGSLFGTASWAENASYALTSSLATNVVGSANRILFNSATNTTTTSNNLTWTDSTNLLTLGDATGTAGTISKLALYTSSYGGYGLGVSPAQLDYVSDGSHVFYKNGSTPSELVRITNAGLVGIGTTSPSQKLEVAGYGLFQNGLVGLAGLQFYGDSSSPTGMFLTTAGNVGIGTTSPTAKLEVNGNVYATSFTGSLFGTASYATNAATASNILGGKSTHIPYFITDTTLATSSLYQSGSSTVIINQDNATTANPEALYVWQPHPTSFNVISGKGDINNYLQLNIQNTNQGANASSDVVATANNGSENDNFIDMGINSQNFAGFLGGPNDSYLYTHGHNFWIGNINDGYSTYFFNSSSLVPIITLNSNSALITGSLFGTASWALNAVNATNANNATSASRATIADSATFATTAGNGGVTSIIAGSGITLPFGGTGNVTIVSSGGGGVTIISGSAVTSSFVNSNTWTFNHNLGTRTPTITVFDSDYNQIIPQNISLDTTSSATITFPTLESGFAIASTGGTSGTALSSSYSVFSTYANTASYVDTATNSVTSSYPIKVSGSSIFSTHTINPAGIGADTLNNIFIGESAGSSSIVNNSNFLGYRAGYRAISAIKSNFLGSNAGSNATNAGNSNFLGSNAGSNATNAVYSNFIGTTAGRNAASASSSNFLGVAAGDNATNAGNSNFLGDTAGSYAGNASNSNFMGREAGYLATNASASNFLGSGSGYQAINASFSNFIGATAGYQATYANNSNFFGQRAGRIAASASYSTLLGYQAGYNTAGGTLGIKSNNIIIGTNITLPDGTQDSINLGGIIFATGSYSTITGNPYSGSVATGRVGINKVSPTATLDVSGSVLVTGSLSISGSTTQTGNNTLIGNTVLSGSFEVSGSQTFIGNNQLTGNTSISGSFTLSGSTTNTIIGNTNVYGEFNVSGSSTFSNSLFTVTGSTFVKGTTNISGSTNITGSLNVIGDINVISGSSFTRWGNKLFNYGAFSDYTTQSGSADTAYAITFNTTDTALGIYLSGSSPIKVENTGIYNLQWSGQLKQGAGASVVSIWIRINGTDVPGSRGDVTLASQNNALPAWNYVLPFNANDAIELYWSSTSANTTWVFSPVATTPPRPSTASLIATLTQIA